jgi:hypothetical protein
MDLPLVSGLEIDDDAGLPHDERQTLSRSKNVVAKTLLTNGPLGCQWERISQLDFRDIVHNEVNC